MGNFLKPRDLGETPFSGMGPKSRVMNHQRVVYGHDSILNCQLFWVIKHDEFYIHVLANDNENRLEILISHFGYHVENHHF